MESTYETEEAIQEIQKVELNAAVEQIDKELGGVCVDCHVKAEPWKWTGSAFIPLKLCLSPKVRTTFLKRPGKKG